ncbi:LORF2 protein, partial [Crocuta crocuta]
PLWTIVCRSLKKLKAKLPYDTAVPLLSIHPKKMKTPTKKDICTPITCTPMFIAALSTIAKTWKEPKCPSTDKWIKKIWFIYIMEYYMAMRKYGIWPSVATWMELESVTLSEISQAEKDRHHMPARIGGL